MNIYYMTNRFKFLVTFIPLLFITNLIAQQEGDPFQNNPSEKMFLPTPEQASLMKFTDIPVGNHTGVHGFSVPIYTINGKDFSLPISINYHGGGIKVDELSGSVGTGWALSIGGISFSEEVRGERDLNGNIEKLNYFDIISFSPEYGDHSQGGSTHYQAALKMTGIQTSGLPGVPMAELQPDYYSYSLLNNNGRFIRDNNNKPHTVPKDDVLIWAPQSQGQQYQYNQQLTDNKGINYYFSSYLQDHSPGLESNSFQPRLRYSYKIDSIVIPNSGTIKFEYHQVSYKYISSRSRTKKMRMIGNSLIAEPVGVFESISTVTEYLPKSVFFKQVKVDFKYKMNGNLFLGRLDVNQGGGGLMGQKGGILEFIEVWDITSNTKVKDYKLISDYFDNSNTNNVLYNRLRLKKIEDLKQETAYEFKYAGEETNEYLPPRFSFSQDYWGMHNGKNNSTSIPEVYYKQGTEVIHIQGANKEPVKHYAQLGSLINVKLPTGGSQEFEYELDEFRNVEFEDDPIPMPVHDYQQHESTIVDVSFPFNHSNYNQQIININPGTPDFRSGFNHVLSFSTNDSPETYNPGNGGFPIETYYYAEVLENGTVISDRIYIDGGLHELPSLSPLKTYQIRITKQNGDDTGIHHPSVIEISMGLEWTNDYVTNPQNRNAGTLRIKSITLKDADGNGQIKKTYSYKDFDNLENPEISSGIFTATKPFPHTYITSYDEYLPNSSSPITYVHLNIPDNGLLNQNTSFGKSVVYKKVTETYESTKPEDVGKNHKKEYIFSTPPPLESYGFMPVIPPPHEDYYAGLVLEERVKNSQNQLVKLTKNVYNNEDPDFFFNQFSGNYFSYNSSVYSSALSPTLAVSNLGFEIVYVASLPMMVYQFEKNYSYVTSAWMKLLETTTESYENGTMTQAQTQKYKYDDSNNEFKNIHPVETITYNSKNEELKTEYVYGHPYKKDEPTIIKQYEKNSPTYVKETAFQGGLPKYEFAKKASSTLDNVLPSEDLMVTYDSYDSNGNLTQYTLANGTPVSIIWGYSGQYPLAKVEGVTYNTLSSYTGTLQPASNNGTLTPASFESLRNLTGALVTSYIYKPLLGITSITQPNGQTEYYSYDAAGRLEEIYIMEMVNNVPVKRVLKKTKYNYQP